MECRYSKIIIDKESLSGVSLISRCHERINSSRSQWERDLYSFILEWINELDYVEAHTSGSTGVPKVIRIKKESMINSALLTCKTLNLKRGDTSLLCLSTNYIAGKMMVVRSIVFGLNMIAVEPSGHPLSGLSCHIDFAAMVPLQVINSLEEPSHFANMRHLIIGGGAVDRELISCLDRVPSRCYSTYGMTETVSHVALKRLNGDNRSDTFKALGDVHFKTDSRGCLVIDAPHILDDELVTNDIVELINEREFKWLGRYDNVINSGGVKLMAEKLEHKLGSVMQRRYFIAGKAHARLGQCVVLIVEGPQWNDCQIADLKSKLKGLLDKYEQPHEILFVPSFKETPTGKVKRSATLKMIL